MPTPALCPCVLPPWVVCATCEGSPLGCPNQVTHRPPPPPTSFSVSGCPCQVWIVDPYGSALFQYVKEGTLGTTGKSFIEGIGKGRRLGLAWPMLWCGATRGVWLWWWVGWGGPRCCLGQALAGSRQTLGTGGRTSTRRFEGRTRRLWR
jgi:hypothetical protein